MMWIGSDKEVNEWLPQAMIEISTNKINFTLEEYYRCNIYVHQAKVQPSIDKVDTCSPQLIAIINGKSESTKVSFGIFSWILNNLYFSLGFKSNTFRNLE